MPKAVVLQCIADSVNSSEQHQQACVAAHRARAHLSSLEVRGVKALPIHTSHSRALRNTAQHKAHLGGPQVGGVEALGAKQRPPGGGHRHAAAGRQIEEGKQSGTVRHRSVTERALLCKRTPRGRPTHIQAKAIVSMAAASRQLVGQAHRTARGGASPKSAKKMTCRSRQRLQRVGQVVSASVRSE